MSSTHACLSWTDDELQSAKQALADIEYRAFNYQPATARDIETLRTMLAKFEQPSFRRVTHEPRS